MAFGRHVVPNIETRGEGGRGKRNDALSADRGNEIGGGAGRNIGTPQTENVA